MNVLLDTCSFLWALREPERLSPEAVRVLDDPETGRFLSPVSVWEIAAKYRLGRFDFPEPASVFIPRAIEDLALEPLPLEMGAAILAATLPPHHKDPFDRMLVCQAMHHNLTILTPDNAIRQYGVACLW
jgi:PIN domain nuclease of toxin-antitoxin system